MDENVSLHWKSKILTLIQNKKISAILIKLKTYVQHLLFVIKSKICSCLMIMETNNIGFGSLIFVFLNKI